MAAEHLFFPNRTFQYLNMYILFMTKSLCYL